MRVNCSSSTPPGRYVIIQQPTTGVGSLTVCELEVYRSCWIEYSVSLFHSINLYSCCEGAKCCISVNLFDKLEMWFSFLSFFCDFVIFFVFLAFPRRDSFICSLNENQISTSKCFTQHSQTTRSTTHLTLPDAIIIIVTVIQCSFIVISVEEHFITVTIILIASGNVRWVVLLVVWECCVKHLLVEISGGVTGGFGWVQTHPLSKKAPMRFSQIRRLFGGWGGGVGGGVGLREKKHELCQIVLNKQQHQHLCYYSVQLRSLIYCSDHCRFWNPIQSRFA